MWDILGRKGLIWAVRTWQHEKSVEGKGQVLQERTCREGTPDREVLLRDSGEAGQWMLTVCL
jgi:hypothetical protein